LADQLRWILSALSALLLAGIWWWGVRRSRQSPGNAELRESTLGIGTAAGHVAGSVEDESPTSSRVYEASREWGVPPFEPLSIRTVDFAAVQFEDSPMTAQSDPLESSLELGVAERETAANSYANVPTLAMNDAISTADVESSPVPPPPPPPPMNLPPAPSEPSGSSASTTQSANACETQRIISVRVCAPGDLRWAGSDLMAALEKQGLAHGRYQVFHRRHSDGRTLFCAASLIEPGTFDIARMPEEEFRGLTLFAVLPGPAEPVQTVEALIATAAGLAEALRGVVQDSNGAPLTQQRAEAMRDDVIRFQALLTMN
jgi:cell division protein ZipA